MYDLIIIGAGPAGLSLAHYLRKTYKKILIIEKESSIGGAHTVERVNYNDERLFSEHSPRVYIDNYTSFIEILEEIDYNFYDNFELYKFSSYDISRKTLLSTLSYYEIFILGLEFMKLVYDFDHGKNYNLKVFLTDKKFKPESIDVIDRLCRLTDGAGVEKFTINELLQIFNQNVFYNLYEPKTPNDLGLFKKWENFLKKSGIEIKTDTVIEKINTINDEVDSIVISSNNKIEEISCKKLVIATPPMQLVNILNKNEDKVKYCFGDLENYAKNTEYNTYVSITFHWNKKIKVPHVHGFPFSDWGLIFINMSDYMKFNEKSSRTVISTTVSILNVKSKFTNKTANESTKDEVISEVFRQLKASLGKNLEDPTVSLMYNGVYYDNKINEWKSDISGFISTMNQGFIDFDSKTIKGIYNVGIHNGHQKIKYTVLESSISNSIALACKLDPSLEEKYKIRTPFDLTTFIRIILIFIAIILFLIIKECLMKNY